MGIYIQWICNPDLNNYINFMKFDPESISYINLLDIDTLLPQCDALRLHPSWSKIIPNKPVSRIPSNPMTCTTSNSSKFWAQKHNPLWGIIALILPAWEVGSKPLSRTIKQLSCHWLIP